MYAFLGEPDDELPPHSFKSLLLDPEPPDPEPPDPEPPDPEPLPPAPDEELPPPSSPFDSILYKKHFSKLVIVFYNLFSFY